MSGPGSRVNRWLDALASPIALTWSRPMSTFRLSGVIAAHVAVVACTGFALAHALPLHTVAAIVAASIVSFLGWTYLRRLGTGVERLVLLEHAWLVWAVGAVVAWALDMDWRRGLDVVSIGLCAFCAIARVGCLMVGCCHGVPSNLGIAYAPDHAVTGFPPHLCGVRLVPVPALEAAAWGAIGVGAPAFAAAPGVATVWVAIAYAVVRFGLEFLRGDDRPMLASRSQAQWMCALQAVAAIALWDHLRGEFDARRVGVVLVALVMTLVGTGLASPRFRARRRMLAPDHRAEVVAMVARLAGEDAPGVAVGVTGCGVRVAVSRGSADGGAACLHVSCALPTSARDPRLAAELVGRSLPSVDSSSGVYLASGALHILASEPVVAPDDRDAAVVRWQWLYGDVLRRLQGAASEAPVARSPERATRTAEGFSIAAISVEPQVSALENRHAASVAVPGSRLPTPTSGTD